MKIWRKIRLKDRNREIELISKSLTNYLFRYGPIDDLVHKYKIGSDDRKKIDQYTANRIAGILLLYMSKDIKRINDIVNKYNVPDGIIKEVIPELEGYIDR